MSLLCGARGKYPCPICLVPQAGLMKIWKEEELRTGEKARELFKQAQKQKYKKDAESIMKSWSLRQIPVCFSIGITKSKYTNVLYKRMPFLSLTTLIHTRPSHLTGSMHSMLVYLANICGLC